MAKGETQARTTKPARTAIYEPDVPGTEGSHSHSTFETRYDEK